MSVCPALLRMSFNALVACSLALFSVIPYSEGITPCYAPIAINLPTWKMLKKLYNMLEMFQDTDAYQIEELRIKIEKVVSLLPQDYRESFVMHRFQQMSYKEIASTLGVSPKTIDYRIQQALKLLRIELQDYLPLILLLYFTEIN